MVSAALLPLLQVADCDVLMSVVLVPLDLVPWCCGPGTPTELVTTCGPTSANCVKIVSAQRRCFTSI